MPSYKISINQNALADIEEISEWYNGQKENLGIAFKKQLISQIDELIHFPKSASIRYKNVRCLVIKKFPFMVHYTVNDTSKLVEVYAVLHTSRNPTTWKNIK